MGRVLCSIVADDCGWHDTISGLRRRAARRARASATGSYQTLRNDFHRNGRDNFLVELGKHGLGKRDVVANVNFFVRGRASTTTARCAWIARQLARRRAVELRFEMDTLVVLSNTPHPLDPGDDATRRRAVELAISDGRAGRGRRSLPAVAARERARLRADRGLRRGDR